MDALPMNFGTLSFDNFDPNAITSDEVINAVLVIDISPSTSGYIPDMNNAFADFVSELQRSHVSEKLMVSVIEFHQKVKVRTGFQPISELDTKAVTFSIPSDSSGTAIYDAVEAAISNAKHYRDNLENSGVNCKTFIFVITDGEDNSSKNPASFVKKELAQIKANEKAAFTFETILFGVGNSANFTSCKDEMGFDHVATVGSTGKEIRKLIGFISASISKSSSGSPIAVTF
jgi:uncharacterized protein YegL